MSLDPYSLCPCGSGKKLKFCCQPVAGEMEKIERMQQGNQMRLALQTLDSLEKKHPDTPWIVTSRAEILLQDGLADEATETLEEFVEQHPDHRYALGLLAVASFAADGFELAKPAIHRAFQRCTRHFPALTADLAMGIAGSMLGKGKYLATRAHLALALRMAPDDNKSDIFSRLLDFDGNRDIPFPLRSVHELADYTPADDRKEEAHKAFVLSNIGCWRPAARIFKRLAEDDSENPDLWYNIGLCRAWDGDETAAAEALHTAARRQDDFETAVEWETLAQLFDHNVTEDRVRFLTREFDVSSVSQLLTRLDDDDRFSRVELGDDTAASGLYYLVDHPERLNEPPENLTIETVPNIHAQVTVFDASDEDDEEPSHAILSGLDGDGFESAVTTFQQAAESLVELAEDEEGESASIIARELSDLVWRWHFPQKTPLRLRRRLEREMSDHVTKNVWPERPQSALNGKSPREAAGDPELHLPLRAAVNVLDAYCDRNRYALPIRELLDSLQIPPPAVVQVADEQSLNSLTSLQLKRMRLTDLNDEQLGVVLQRAVLISHGGFLHEVLTEVMKRPGCLERFDHQRLLLTFFDLCREQGLHDEALHWIAEGRELAKSDERAFESTLQWVIRELQVRLDDPAASETTALLQHMHDYYFPKIPEMRETVTQLAEAYGVTPPWEEGSVAAGITGASAGEGVWTPESQAAQPANSSKKLWLPGQ